MIPVDQTEVFDRSLAILHRFGDQTSIRRRFVALYLGLRRMHDVIAHLGDSSTTAASEMEDFLDAPYIKTNRPVWE